MPSKTLYMETTSISAEKTAGEISSLLVSAGARQISMEYDEARRPIGATFIMVINAMPMPFKVPVRTMPVYKLLLKKRRDSYREVVQRQVREQAERVAWRQLLRWVQAQLAMIETGMAAAEEVFLPYLQGPNGTTVYEMFAKSNFKALPMPEATHA